MALSVKRLKFNFYAHGPKYVFLIIWIILNIFLFAYDYYNYDTKIKFTYIKKIMGAGLPLARGSAACLNLNCALIILCVCRNLLSVIHNWKHCPRVVRRLINHNLSLHKLCAWSIVLHTVIHTLSHLFNVEFCISYFQRENVVLAGNLSSPISKSLPVDDKDSVYTVLFGSVGGLTGVIMVLVLFLMVTSSIKIVRRSFFEVFWFTHHLFIVFFICLIVHAFGQMIKSLKTEPCVVDSSGVTWCNHLCDKYAFSGLTVPSNMCDSNMLKFKGPGFANWSKSYLWIGIPLIFYIIDRALRWSRRFNPAVVYKAIEHPGPCLELRLRKKGWTQEAGQYVFIQCSELSLFEWHPFTLTSAPEEDYLSVHIRKAGDWTGNLFRAISKHSNQKTKKHGKNTELQFSVAVDGPYGTPSDDIFQYDVSVLVGAGVGVTPYASILKSVWYKLKSGNHNFGSKKLYFYWLCSDYNVFGWFTSLLEPLLQTLDELDAREFLTIKPHLTRFNNDHDLMENVAMTMSEEEDAITKLKGVETKFGRPNWIKEFTEIGEQNPMKDIGVFFCGPAILSDTLDKSCSIANVKLENNNIGSMFFYNKENF